MEIFQKLNVLLAGVNMINDYYIYWQRYSMQIPGNLCVVQLNVAKYLDICTTVMNICATGHTLHTMYMTQISGNVAQISRY